MVSTRSRVTQPNKNIKRASKLSVSNEDNLISEDLHATEQDADQMLRLQRTIGNQATMQVVQRTNKILRGIPNLKMVTPANPMYIQRNDEPDGGAPTVSSGGLTSDAMEDIMYGEVTKLQEASVLFANDARKLMNNLASEAPGSKLLEGPVKSLARVKEKADKKTKKTGDGGTATRSLSSAMKVSGDIKDILRCTLVFDDFKKLATGYGKVAKFLQAARSGMVVGIVKMDSWFGEGAEQSSGYRDAKIVFQVEPRGEAKKKLGSMIRTLPALSIEVQFNVRAALAVKDGKVHGEGEEDWDFEMDGGPLGHQFNAQGFLEKLLAMTADQEGFTTLRGEIEAFMDEHSDELTAGLPIAHHLYEPEKVAKLSEATGMPEDEIASHYNELYHRLYEFAYRASKFRLSSVGADGKEKATTGKGLDAAYKSMKRRYVKR